ncbi:MAG: signal peptidase I [Oscillospiraceae bacterium]|nr:signal peptidase I [Oscillospiraceae bacterium]
MQKTAKLIWNAVTWTIVVVVLVFALLLVGGRLFGMRSYAVLSGSMEPTYHTGSIIYVKKIADTTKIPDGTVITFMMDEDTVATHRVVGAVPDEDDPSVVRYRTKGDANDSEDGTLVHYKNIIGTPVFTIPKLGYVANYIQQPPGLYMTISFGAMLVLMMFLPELIGVLNEDDGKVKEPRPAKEPKPRRVKAPKAPKAEKAPRVKKPRPARPAKRPEPEYVQPEPEATEAEPEYFAVQVEAPVEPEPVIAAAPAPLETIVVEETVRLELPDEKPRRRGAHQHAESAGRSLLGKPARPQKKKGGAHVIEKPRKH